MKLVIAVIACLAVSPALAKDGHHGGGGGGMPRQDGPRNITQLTVRVGQGALFDFTGYYSHKTNRAIGTFVGHTAVPGFTTFFFDGKLVSPKGPHAYVKEGRLAVTGH